MRRYWNREENNLLEAFLKMGWSHKDISLEMNRSVDAISTHASKLKLKSKHSNQITNETIDIKAKELNFKRIDNYINLNAPIRFKCLKCNGLWITEPFRLLNNKTKCSTCKTLKEEKEFDEILTNKSIKRLTKYTKSYVKLKFQCYTCNNIWEAESRNIIKGSGCPNCAKYGFNTNIPATLYCIYFEELDLYKVGITNNINNRMFQFGVEPELIFLREFELGKDAKDLETKWLKNIKEYKVNTGKLRSGNTETFRYGNK
jgi:Zn finger protein HypA/HybF involved in hydrogenase expression